MQSFCFRQKINKESANSTCTQYCNMSTSLLKTIEDIQYLHTNEKKKTRGNIHVTAINRKFTWQAITP